MLRPLLVVALLTVPAVQAAVVALQQSVPQSTCVELVAAAKDQSEREATYAVYTRCRLHGLRGGILEPGCRELARLYSVARHYKDAAGGKLAPEDFCATAVGSALEQGPMQEVDACVAGAEEVLSSSEVSEAAEKACRKAHPKAAEAPAACRMYVTSLAEALRHTPAGELVDAESICGKLVSRQDSAVASPQETNNVAPEEGKFVSSCVQFAGNLMNTPGIGEDQVRKSCEAHLSSEEKTFCSGYARLVYQRADASDFSNFCVAEYRRMTLVAKAPMPVPPEHAQQPKKASTMAMNMPALCARLFNQAVAGGLSGIELRRTASDLCAQELNGLDAAQRPPASRVRVGCKFFANRLATMKEQQQGTATSAEAFCAHIASPQRSPQPQTASKALEVKVVANSSPIQAHGPAPPAALISPTPAVTKPSQPQQPPPQPLPVLSASAALPALAAAATVVVPSPPGPEEAAKAKSDEDFLSKFLNKYEATTAGNEASAAKATAPPSNTQMSVFRDDEMAEVRRKAEQLFGSDVEPEQAGGAAPATVAAPAAPALTVPAKPAAVVPPPAAPPQPVAPTQPEAAVVQAATPPVPAKVSSKASAPANASKKTSLLSMGGGNQDAADFLSSFLSAYSGNSVTPPPAVQPVAQSPPQPPQPAAPIASPVAVSPLALLEAPSAAIPQSGGSLDVDSLVSAFLAKTGN